MARTRDYAAEYRKRIARAMAKGRTRQQARGHRQAEHIIRKEREIERNQGLTNQQLRIVFNWATMRQSEIHDADQDPMEIVEAAKNSGYEWFKNYRKTWDLMRRTYLKEVANGTYTSRGMGYLQHMASLVKPPVEELSWLYYH